MLLGRVYDPTGYDTVYDQAYDRSARWRTAPPEADYGWTRPNWPHPAHSPMHSPPRAAYADLHVEPEPMGGWRRSEDWSGMRRSRSGYVEQPIYTY